MYHVVHMRFEVKVVYVPSWGGHEWVEVWIWPWGCNGLESPLSSCWSHVFGVSLQGQNTLTRRRLCHLSESDSVGLSIVWQFVNYLESKTTFTVFSKMVPHSYKSMGLIYIAFRVWICIWNVWFGWDMLMFSLLEICSFTMHILRWLCRTILECHAMTIL